MKKCPGCERELDKHGIACQYCGEVERAREKEKAAENKRAEKAGSVQVK